MALMLFLPMCIYWYRDIVICFKELLKDPNVNHIMEQIKLSELVLWRQNMQVEVVK